MSEIHNGPLKKNGIGLLGAATLGVVMLSPAMTLYGGFGPAFLNAGAAAPLAFIWALLATLPTVCSYLVLSQDHPSSGSASDWADKAFSHRVGVWAGWMVFLYYLTNFIIQPVTMGVFAGDLFKLVDIVPNYWTFAVGVLICMGWSASFVYRGISNASKGALGFLLLESVVVVALCISVIYFALTNGVHLSTEGFHLSASPTGSSGVFRAMVFAMLAFCGFDVVSTLSEETHEPKKNIPRATFLALVIFAAIIIVGIWALTFGASREELQKIAEAGQMPITEVSKRVWGIGGVLIPLTGLSATLGLAIATAIGASRVLFSMGRSGLTSKKFALLGKGETPINALHLIFACGVLMSLVTAVFLGPFDAYVWWGTTSTFFAMITYALVNASNLVLNRSRMSKNFKSICIYGLIPFFGLAIDFYLLYRTFFVELWGQGWATGQSVVVFDLFCCITALFVAFRTTKPTALIVAEKISG